MAQPRENPYGAFNFIVSIGNDDGTTTVGGFSDVSGLGAEIQYSEYRNGNESFNTVRKIGNTTKNDDVTLKRGVVGSLNLFEWFDDVRGGAYAPRNVTIKLLNEAREEVAVFRLLKAQPKKWVGPTLAAKGAGEVAMEELHLVHEGIEYE